MVKRKILVKLREYNDIRKEMAQKRWKKLDMLEGNDNSKQNSEEYSSQEEYNEEEYSDEEYSDQEKYEGVDDEERTHICLLTFGASGTLTNAAKGTSKITNFFGPLTSALPTYSALWTASLRHLILAKLNYDEDESENSDADGGDDNSEEAHFELGDVIAQLQDKLLKNERTFTTLEYNKRQAVYEYFVRVYDGHGKVKASEVAVSIVYIIPNTYKCKRIRFLVDLRESRINDISSSQFRQYVNSVILPEHTGGIKKAISLRTAKRWLNILEKMKILEWWMATYKGIKMEWVPPVLRVDERELILVTYDECIFYSYDGKRGIWIYGGMMPLRKKGSRKSIMVKAHCYLKPSKNKENYWTIEHLLKQIKEKAIPIFEAKFPSATASLSSIIRAQEMVFEEDYSDLNLRGKPKGIKKGLMGKLAEYVCKKFKSHRRVPENELASFVQENREVST
ncbi:2926_t:CDS:2, partial [Cetraspora pellucida]